MDQFQKFVEKGMAAQKAANDKIQEFLNDQVSEKQWQQQVEDIAGWGKWIFYHTWNSRHSASGFLDLILLRHTRMVVAELKRERGKETLDQKVWLEAFRSIPGAEVFVWRPSDIDEVIKVLK